MTKSREQTEKKRNQLVRKRAATHARLRLAVIVESSDDAIIGKEMDGIITDWNDGAERLYGYSAVEVVGKPISILIPPDRANDFSEIMRKIKHGDRVSKFETVRQKKDGTLICISLTVSPIIDCKGRIVGASAIARDIGERKRAENGLRDSEERLRLAVQAGKMYAFDWDVATDAIIRSEDAARIPGLVGEPTRLTKQQLLASVHPEDRATFINSTAERTPESPDTQITYRLLRPDGSILWLERTGHAFFDEEGRMVRMIGMVADVTERKLAEEALSNVGGRLIQAHEEERSRIARDLHDDIGQRLALLTNNLALMEQHPPGSVAEIRKRTQGHLQRLREIAVDVQAMSHRLHSSKLRYLGIVAAAKSFCQELSEQREVEIDFTHVDAPPAVPEDISLCLFRVLQEALQNAVKHSGVSHIEVEIRGASDVIHLTVRDEGVGFDPEAVVTNRGLGLVSMQERVNLVKGTISITSRPQSGTEINVHVPLSAGEQTEQAKLAGA
jgi:PAS domain S-box-containing protein